MRIGIDARMMGAGNTRGIGRYIEEMVKAMLPELRQNETIVLFERDPNASLIHHSQVEHVQVDIPWYGFAEQLKLPTLFNQAKLDTLWVPHWNIPILYRGKLVTTIHDLLLINQKRSAKISTRNPIIFYIKYFAFRIALHFALKKSLAILPPTEAIKKEIEAFAPNTSPKLVVTGEGLGHIRKNSDKLFEQPYLFYLGSAYPHKRLDLALTAWKDIAPKHPELHFLIAGEKDVFMRRLEERANREKLPRVTFLGAVTDSELSSYLTHAAAHLFPTEYEGFGLPPAEALLCRTPVIASDIPVLREVLPEEGVFFFHKGSANDMISAIESMLGRDNLAGELERAAEWIYSRHTWQKSAAIVLEAIRKTASDQDYHDEKARSQRGDSGMEKDEHQSRAGTPA